MSSDIIEDAVIVPNDEQQLVVQKPIETKLTDFNSVQETLDFATHLIKSKALPPGYNTPEKVLVGIQRGRELGLSPLASLTNLALINGVPSPTVHLLVAKAKEAGVMFTIKKDFEKIFEPVFDANGDQVIEDGKPKVKADVITTIQVSQFKHGRWFDNEISYRWSEATSADLVTKD